ncbi:MAG: hypothetical protein OEY79_03410, partial [Anaplasmataceae bacterium]|nr:hypothetical protein [Anaplasmataceae bacterium]
DVNEYFDLSYDLITQFNNSEFTNLIISRKGKTISLKEIQDKFQESFPVNDINHVKFMCDNNNNLVEIFIDLPATIKKGDTLIDLIARLNDKGCGKSTCDGRKIINILS